MEDAVSSARMMVRAASVTEEGETGSKRAEESTPIWAVSAICHKSVFLDGASDEPTTHMTQLSLVRTLGGGVGMYQFLRDMDAEITKSMPQLLKMVNERSLLNRLFTQLGIWDPDVICGHNAMGYDMEILLTRCAENKVISWSKLGRRRTKPNQTIHPPTVPPIHHPTPIPTPPPTTTPNR